MLVKKNWKKNIKNQFEHFFHPRKSNNHRARMLHFEVLLFLVLVVVGLSLLLRSYFFNNLFQSKILGFASDITADQVIVHTNQKRSALGLAQLTYSQELSQAALSKGQDMFDNQYWSHVSPQGKQPWDFVKAAGYNYLVAGENLARDFNHTQDMVEAWMASPTHRDNIVNPKFSEIGIAVINGTLNGFETTLVVQMFGTRSISPPRIDQVAQVDSQIPQNQNSPEENTPENTQLKQLDLRADQQFVLSEASFSGTTNSERFLINPLQTTKMFFLIIIVLLVFALIYDEFISGKMKLDRLVGDNVAHILLFITVIFLILFFKGGVV